MDLELPETVRDTAETFVSPMELLRAEFNGTYWSHFIEDANFPGADANASIKDVRPVRIRRKTFDRDWAITYLKNRGLKPASLSKCIRWCAAHPDAQRKYWMICLAQSWHNTQAGRHYSVCFQGSAQERSAHVGIFTHRIPEYYKVLVEKMTPEELAAK